MGKENIRPFHLAFPVYSLKKTIQWYTDVLGCSLGRQSTQWVDFNFFGHQISSHLVDKNDILIQTNLVDGHNVPARHFGIVLKILLNLKKCMRKKIILLMIL